MFNHLLELHHGDDSYNWSNIGFGKDITQEQSIEVKLILRTLSGALAPSSQRNKNEDQAQDQI